MPKRARTPFDRPRSQRIIFNELVRGYEPQSLTSYKNEIEREYNRPGRRSTYQFEQDFINRPTKHCNLLQMQCAYSKPGQPQCRRMSAYTLPLCWQHTKLVYGVRIGRTNLVNPATGTRFPFRGLFACRDFKQNEFIVPYVGLHEHHVGVDDGDYLVYAVNSAQRGYIVDSACARGVGSFANTTFAPNTRLKNATLRNTNTFPCIVATKRIKVGDEILIGYGPGARGIVETLSKTTARSNAMKRAEWKC